MKYKKLEKELSEYFGGIKFVDVDEVMNIIKKCLN